MLVAEALNAARSNGVATQDQARYTTLIPREIVGRVKPVDWTDLTTRVGTDGETADPDRLDSIRRQIAIGAYLTDQKLDQVVGSLLDVLHAPASAAC